MRKLVFGKGDFEKRVFGKTDSGLWAAIIFDRLSMQNVCSRHLKNIITSEKLPFYFATSKKSHHLWKMVIKMHFSTPQKCMCSLFISVLMSAVMYALSIMKRIVYWFMSALISALGITKHQHHIPRHTISLCAGR